MNTAQDKPPNLVMQFTCFIVPALIMSNLSQSSMSDTAWILVGTTLLLWTIAAFVAAYDAKSGLSRTAWINMIFLALAGVGSYYASKDASLVHKLAWVYSLPVFLHILILKFFHPKKRVGVYPTINTSNKTMWGAPTIDVPSGKPKRPAPSHVEKHDARGVVDDKELLKHESKGRPATQSKTYQNQAVFTKANFKSVHGMEVLKKQLYDAYKEMFASFTSDAEKRNGILFYGEPGNGKTFLAKCLAGQIGWPFLECTFGGINSKWVGASTENVMQVFDDAIAQAPCVLFIDEIDALLIKRDQITQAESESGKTVTAILTKLVEVRDHMVLVVAATNFIDRLDDAAIREGRFDYKIEIQPPDMSARVGLLTAGLKKNAPAVELNAEIITRISKRWEGFSVARIKSVAFEAAKIAKANNTKIDFACLMSALRVAQGSLGVQLPENTKTLAQMKYDDDVRAILTELAIRMKNIDEIERMGGSVPSGVLFYGPPGTGKTATVRALAKSSGWALLTTSGKDLNATESAVNEIYAKARNLRPCIVFIDEAEDIFANRETSWNRSMTNKMLSVMDGAGGKSHDILWVAATNSPDSIDAAALRGGRFTEKVEFRLPSVRVVAEFVKAWDEANPASIEANLTYAVIADMLLGQSIANIEAIMQASVNSMIGRTAGGNLKREVVREDMDKAIRSVVARE